MDTTVLGTTTRLIPAELAEWDSFAASHRSGSLFHTSRWQHFLETAFPHMKGCVLAIKDTQSGKITAGLPIYEVRSWILGKRLITVPFANWCQPLASGPTQLAALLQGVEEHTRATSARSATIALKQPVPTVDQKWVQESSWVHHWINLDRRPEELFQRFSRTAVRQLVRKAERNGILVTRDRSKKELLRFHRLLVQSRCRLGLPPIPYRVLAARRAAVAPDSQALLMARVDSTLLGGVTLLFDRGECHLEFAGQADGTRKTGVMPLLYWRAINMAYDVGCRRFSFGRTARDQTGLAIYKRRWSTQEEELPCLHLTRHSHGPQLTNSARPFVRRFIQQAPVPVSQIVGAYLYRHW